MIQVDKSALPKELFDNPQFLQAEQEFLEKLSNPDYRTRTCIHEAGHEWYSRKVGLETEWHGPQAEYQPPGSPAHTFLGLGPNVIRIGICSASVDTIPETYKGEGLDTPEYGKCVGAGIAAERVFYGVERCELSTSGDFLDFLNTWKPSYPNATEEQFVKAFEACVAEVEKEFTDPAVREELRQIAKEFEQEVFGDSIAVPSEGCTVGPQGGPE